MLWMSEYPLLVASPNTQNWPFVADVSTATCEVRVLAEHVVENGVGNLITDLVGMSFGNGFRGDQLPLLP